MNSTDSGSVPIPGFTGTFEQAVQITWVTTYLDVVAAALVTYDPLITLDQEIRLVWRGHWGKPSIAYALSRYGTVIMANLNLVAELDWQLSDAACYSWNVFSVWNIPIILMLVEANLTMRVIALYGNRRWWKIGLWTWYLLCVTGMLAVNGISIRGSFAVPSPAPPTLGCQIAGSFSAYWGLWVPSLVLETTLAGLTLARAIHHKSLLETAPLFFVLVRDGFFYFFVVVILMLVNLIIPLTLNTIYIGWFPQISVCVASVIAARMFLNLRETARPADQTQMYEMPDVPTDITASTTWRTGGHYWLTPDESTTEPWTPTTDDRRNSMSPSAFASTSAPSSRPSASASRR